MAYLKVYTKRTKAKIVRRKLSILWNSVYLDSLYLLSPPSQLHATFYPTLPLLPLPLSSLWSPLVPLLLLFSWTQSVRPCSREPRKPRPSAAPCKALSVQRRRSLSVWRARWSTGRRTWPSRVRSCDKWRSWSRTHPVWSPELGRPSGTEIKIQMVPSPVKKL